MFPKPFLSEKKFFSITSGFSRKRVLRPLKGTDVLEPTLLKSLKVRGGFMSRGARERETHYLGP